MRTSPLTLWALLITIGCSQVQPPAPLAASHEVSIETFRIHRPQLRKKSGGNFTPPLWVVDPSNVSSCASDNNSCTSATCGEGRTGPCATFAAIASRKGTAQLRGITQVEFISRQNDDSDPMTLAPNLLAPGYLEIFGAPMVGCTATLSGTIPKNRTHSQLLTAQADVCFTGPDLMVTNTTHPSVAWTKAIVPSADGGPSFTATLSQPADNNSYVSVDAWADGDSVTVSTPLQVNLHTIRASGVDSAFQVWIHDLTLWAPHSFFDLTVVDGGVIYMDQVQVQGGELYAHTPIGFQCDNCDFPAGTELDMVFPGAEIDGAALWGLYQNGFQKMGGSYIGGDIIFAGDAPLETNFTFIGSAYIEAPLNVRGPTVVVGNAAGLPLSGPTIWGPGQVQVLYSSRLNYNGPGASILLNTGGLSINPGTGALVCAPPITCGLTLTAAALDQPPPTGFGGNAFVLGGGSIARGTD